MANKVIASKGNNEVTRNDNPSMGMISLFLSLPKNHVLYGQSIDILKKVTDLDAVSAFGNHWEDTWYFRFDYAYDAKSPFKNSHPLYKDEFAEEMLDCVKQEKVLVQMKAQLTANIDAMKECMQTVAAEADNHSALAKNFQSISDLAKTSGELLAILSPQ